MGDARYGHAFERLRRSRRRDETLRALTDDEVVAALAHASRESDPFLANILATEALNRVRRARAVFLCIGEGALVLDERGRVVDANPGASSVLGWPREAMVGHDAHELLHDDEPEACALWRAWNGGGPGQLETEFRTESGAHVPVLARVGPIEEEGEARGWVVAFGDVSAQRDAQARLRRSEEGWRRMADVTTEGLVIHDQGRILLYNRAAAELFRVPLDAYVGRSIFEFVTPAYEARALDALRQDNPEPYEVEALRTDGSTFTARIGVARFPWEGRDARAILVRDVSEGHAAQRDALRRAEEARSLFDGHPDLGLMIDAKGRILAVNRSFEEGTHCRGADLLGRPATSLVVPADIPSALEAMRIVLDGQPERRSLSFHDLHGETIHASVLFLPMRTNGTITGLFAMAHRT